MEICRQEVRREKDTEGGRKGEKELERKTSETETEDNKQKIGMCIQTFRQTLKICLS